MQIFIYPLFALAIFLNVAFLKLGGSVPLRILVLAVAFGLVIAFHIRHFRYFVDRHKYAVGLFFFIAILGSVLTLAQGDGMGATALHLLRQILQPFMLLVCAYTLCYLVGVERTSALLFAALGATIAVALAQAMGINFAWKLREAISAIQNDPAMTAAVVRGRTRVMGLSFSPIEFSYQLAAGYVLSFILLRADVISSRTYYLIVGVILAGAVVNGTRSLVLGMVVHEFIRYLSKADVKAYALLVVAFTIGYFTIPYLMDSGHRLVSVEDQSASGRKILFKFGAILFSDNILGLGWSFSPQDYAWLYWEHLADFGKPEIVYRLNLHNALLIYLLIYGVMGILPILFFVFRKPRSTVLFAFCFVSYFIHSFFHNKGLFLADQFIWIAVAVFLYLQNERRLRLFGAGP